MSSPKIARAVARSEMIAAVKRIIFPLLQRAGFEAMPHEKATSLLVYHWHRPVAGGGYHLFDIVFDAKHRPEFGAMLQEVPRDGLACYWGEHVSSDRVTAGHHLKRVFLQKRNPSIFARVMPIWIKHIYFGIKSNSDRKLAQQDAEQACAEFWECFSQAENWWKNRSLGPNLFEGEIVVTKSTANTQTNRAGA